MVKCPECNATMRKDRDVYVCEACTALFIPSTTEGVFVSGSIIGINQKRKVP